MKHRAGQICPQSWVCRFHYAQVRHHGEQSKENTTKLQLHYAQVRHYGEQARSKRFPLTKAYCGAHFGPHDEKASTVKEGPMTVHAPKCVSQSIKTTKQDQATPTTTSKIKNLSKHSQTVDAGNLETMDKFFPRQIMQLQPHSRTYKSSSWQPREQIFSMQPSFDPTRRNNNKIK